MNFDRLSKIIFDELKPKLQNHKGLSIFAKERAKFEGWLKVEMCDSLMKKFKDVLPEKNRIDITFQDWAIELKTINTNYEGAAKRHRPITRNTNGVVEDIKKLRSFKNIKNKGVLFITFPVKHNNQNWQIQLNRINKNLSKIKFCPFNFKNNNAPGVIYFGVV